jgi:Mor family transcriptional regulator
MNGQKYARRLAKQADRRQKIKELYASGLSLTDLGTRYRVTPGRIWQIVKSK